MHTFFPCLQKTKLVLGGNSQVFGIKSFVKHYSSIPTLHGQAIASPVLPQAYLLLVIKPATRRKKPDRT
jgi:hypothetical protein